MAHLVSLEYCDYRNVVKEHGTFDKVISIEMLEAVGHEHLPSFFQTVSAALKPGGVAAVQVITRCPSPPSAHSTRRPPPPSHTTQPPTTHAPLTRLPLPTHQVITLPDERYEAYCNQHSDFIRKHIFPGGHLPSFTAMQTVAASNGLQLHNALDIGEDYAVSLRHWRERMLARADEARGFGYPERFLRMYEFYFVYCEAGFANRYASGRASGRALGAHSPPNPALLSTG